jgi:hypothetical protein
MLSCVYVVYVVCIDFFLSLEILAKKFEKKKKNVDIKCFRFLDVREERNTDIRKFDRLFFVFFQRDNLERTNTKSLPDGPFSDVMSSTLCLRFGDGMDLRYISNQRLAVTIYRLGGKKVANNHMIISGEVLIEQVFHIGFRNFVIVLCLHN